MSVGSGSVAHLLLLLPLLQALFFHSRDASLRESAARCTKEETRPPGGREPISGRRSPVVVDAVLGDAFTKTEVNRHDGPVM